MNRKIGLAALHTKACVAECQANYKNTDFYNIVES